MAVPTTIGDLSVSEGSNAPLDSESITPTTRPSDYLRAHGAIIRTLAASSTIAAAPTTDLSTVTGTFITLTGAVATITGFGTLDAGIYKFVIYNAAHTLTHNATSLILLGGANRTVAAGDVSLFVSEGAGNWRELVFSDATGYQPLDADLTAIAALTTTAFGRGMLEYADAATAFAALKQAASETATGVVELATTAEAATGTDTQRAVTPAGVTSAIAEHALGEGQTWQDLTASRSLTTNYTNTTGRSIGISVMNLLGPAAIMYVYIDGALAYQDSNGGTFNENTGAFFVIPPGAVYQVTGGTKVKWWELR